MQIPVILYTWRMERELSYYYNKTTTSLQHIQYILAMEDSPFQQASYQFESGQGEYTFENTIYRYWWVANQVTSTANHTSYTRVVLAHIPKHYTSPLWTVEAQKLWEIPDQLPENELQIESSILQKPAIAPSSAIPQQSSITQQSSAIPPSSAMVEQVSIQKERVSEYANTRVPNEFELIFSTPLIKVRSDASLDSDHIFPSFIKQRVASVGKLIFMIGSLCVVLLGLLFSIWLIPSLQHILGRSPIPMFANFYTINKGGNSKLGCPIATPVYDSNFNKVGTIHQEEENAVVVLLFPEYAPSKNEWNVAYYHQESRKLLAIFKLLQKSTVGESIQRELNNLQTELQPIVKRMMGRVIEIIKSNYTLDEQKRLFKALTNEEVIPFVLGPITLKWQTLKNNLENYDYMRTSKPELNKIGSRMWDNYRGKDMLHDAGNIASRLVCSVTSSWISNLFGGFGANDTRNQMQRDVMDDIAEVAEQRLERIISQPDVKTEIKTSAYKVASKIAEDMKLTKDGDFFKSEHLADLTTTYSDKASYVVGKLEENGLKIGKEELVKLWKLLEDDPTLQEEYKKSEETLQVKIGNFLKVYVEQFFPNDPDQASQMEVMATTLMREILYGKPEPIIIMGTDANLPKTGKAKLQKGKF